MDLERGPRGGGPCPQLLSWMKPPGPPVPFPVCLAHWGAAIGPVPSVTPMPAPHTAGALACSQPVPLRDCYQLPLPAGAPQQ